MIYISYIGIGYMVLLFLPNIIWTKFKPQNYDSSHEARLLVILERVGEILTTFFAIVSFRQTTYQIDILFVLSVLCMLLYEGYWLYYFKSDHQLSDFYCSFCRIPLAGATLPIMAFVFLSLCQHNWLLLTATFLLGIGHIGIHYQHFCELHK